MRIDLSQEGQFCVEEWCREKDSFVIGEVRCPVKYSLLHIIAAGEDGWSGMAGSG